MDYCKITTEGRAMNMPNPYHLSVANPTDEQKAIIADFDNWLEKVYTDKPEYDPETQYVTDYWEEENYKAVQHWEIHELPEQEADLEDYQTQMEKLGVSDEHTD